MLTQQQFLVITNLLDDMLVICREHQSATRPNEVVVGDVLANLGGWVLHCKNRINVCIHYITAEDVAELLHVHVHRPLLAVSTSALEEHQEWAVGRLKDMLAEWVQSR